VSLWLSPNSISTELELLIPGGCPNPTEGLPSSTASLDELVTSGDLSGVWWDGRRTLGLSTGGLMSSSMLLIGDAIPVVCGEDVKSFPGV